MLEAGVGRRHGRRCGGVPGRGRPRGDGGPQRGVVSREARRGARHDLLAPARARREGAVEAQEWVPRPVVAGGDGDAGVDVPVAVGAAGRAARDAEARVGVVGCVVAVWRGLTARPACAARARRRRAERAEMQRDRAAGFEGGGGLRLVRVVFLGLAGVANESATPAPREEAVRDVLRDLRDLVESGWSRRVTAAGTAPSKPRISNGTLRTHFRTGTSRKTRSTRWAAVPDLRRALQLGHTPRFLHENATASPRPHASQRARTKPRSSRPHCR